MRVRRSNVLNGGAVALDSQRRKPLEIVANPSTESRSDGISAKGPQDSIPLRLGRTLRNGTILYISSNCKCEFGVATVLNGGAVALDSQRRKPLEIAPNASAESRSDGISAKEPQDSIPLRLGRALRNGKRLYISSNAKCEFGEALS